jgi:hypothetical protein
MRFLSTTAIVTSLCSPGMSTPKCQRSGYCIAAKGQKLFITFSHADLILYQSFRKAG